MSYSFSDDMYPSAYFKASDLSRDTAMTISSVDKEQIGRDQQNKFVVHFREHLKGLVLNKTNGREIAKAYGDNTADWIGKEVVLYPTRVPYAGDMVDALRVKIPSPELGLGASPKAAGNSSPDDGDMDDSVPF